MKFTIGIIAFALFLTPGRSFAATSPDTSSFAAVVRDVQPKVVKVFGAGGLRGLESYQSGFLISAEGHVLTVWSYVLDTEFVSVVLDDGRRFQGKLVGADPRLEIAILKIDSDALPHFVLEPTAGISIGARILAFSNLFGVAHGDEQASVLHGNVAAHTRLAARRGAYQTRYHGPVYVLDAMTNNPGAAGGALTDQHGKLIGILGKELRNAHNHTWLNYAIPTSEFTKSTSDILSGRNLPRLADENMKLPAAPHTLARLGVILVPEVLDKTPPYIERVVADSVADRAGLRPDDLILFVGDRGIPSIAALVSELRRIDRLDEVKLLVIRAEDLMEVILRLE